MYECPFCCEVTEWELTDEKGMRLYDEQSEKHERVHFAKCTKCANEGTMKPHRCSRCLVKDKHVYRDLVKEMDGEEVAKCIKCADCHMGMGNKDVIAVSVMHCLFCKWRIQTFYEYGIG